MVILALTLVLILVVAANRKANTIYITYREFLEFYLLNPDRWILSWGGASVRQTIIGPAGQYIYRYYDVKLKAPLDYFNYVRFYVGKEYKKAKAAKEKENEKFLDLMKEDNQNALS
jgi:hypothetical protein